MMKFKSLFIFALFSCPAFSSTITVIDIDTCNFPDPNTKRVRVVSFEPHKRAYTQVSYYQLPSVGGKTSAPYTMSFNCGGVGTAPHSISFQWQPTLGIITGEEFNSPPSGFLYRVKKTSGRVIYRNDRDALSLPLGEHIREISQRNSHRALATSTPSIPSITKLQSLGELPKKVNIAERRVIGELATRLTFLRLRECEYRDVKIKGDQGFDGAFIRPSDKVIIRSGEVILSESKCHSQSPGSKEMVWARNLGIDVVDARLRNLQAKKHPFFAEFLEKLRDGYVFWGLYNFVSNDGIAGFYLRPDPYNNGELISRIFPLIIEPAIEVAQEKAGKYGSADGDVLRSYYPDDDFPVADDPAEG